MFERFTEPARAVLVEAQDLALELGSGYITPTHLLYGCAAGREETAGRPLRDAGITATSIRRVMPRVEEQPTGQVDPEALGALGVDYDAVRAAAERTFGPGALDAAADRRTARAPGRKPPFTPEAKRSLQIALRVAVELHDNRLAPGHLLLALLRLDDEYVTAVLARSGVSVADLSSDVLARLSAAA